MKKVLALVLAAVMALSLAAVASAAPLEGPNTDPSKETGAITGNELIFGDDDTDLTFYLENTADDDFDVTDGTDPDEVVNVEGDTFYNTGEYSLSVSVSSDNSDVKASYKLIKNKAKNGVAIEVKIAAIAEKFTVADAADWEVKIKVVQVKKGEPKVTGDLTIKGTVDNTRADDTDVYEDANGNYILETDARVIDVSVFEEADGNALSVNYDDYTVKFAKVAKQNTSLYLYAKTGVVDVEGTKAIASIGFKPTRVKDAATITMPISADNQNYYGETVYVYNVVDGKPTGEAIAAEVVNHNSIIFNVPAGTTLGTFAAYGAKEEGDAEKPAIPETGANDIVNIAIVFAVVALAAAGFVAVKKAGK